MGALGIVLVVGMGAFFLHSRSDTQETPPRQPQGGQTSGVPAPPPPQDKPDPLGETSTLSLIGSVQADALATLSARMPARIVRVGTTEGATVRRGQLLVQLDDAEFRGQERTAQAGVTAAQAQLAKAKAGYAAQRVKADAEVQTAQNGLHLAQQKLQQAALARDAARAEGNADLTAAEEGVHKAEIGLDRAKKTLHDLEELDKVGGVSRNELEGARTQVTLAQSDLDGARAQVKRLKEGPNGVSYRVALAQKDVDQAEEGVRQAQQGIETAEEGRKQTLAVADKDTQAAQAALTQAQAGVSSAHAAVLAMQVVSPLDGIATGLAARAGETAQPGVPLVTVVSLASLRVDALVPSRQLPRLPRGQAVKITVDTQPGTTFAANVSEISPIAEPDGRTFRVKFRFPHPVALRPGQTAQITIFSDMHSP